MEKEIHLPPTSFFGFKMVFLKGVKGGSNMMVDGQFHSYQRIVGWLVGVDVACFLEKIFPSDAVP